MRRLLLQATAPEVQCLFHRLHASRTPDEWVEREVTLRTLIAELAVEIFEVAHTNEQLVSFKPYCPACHAAVPVAKQRVPVCDADHPILRHLEGIGGVPPCPVVGELIEYSNTEVSPTKFPAEAVALARVRYEELAAPPRAHARGAKARKPPGRTGLRARKSA